MKDYSELDEKARDLLRELGNIGTGNAAASLSQLLAFPVEISPPKLSIVKYNDLFSALDITEKMQTGIMVEISGEMSGIFLFLLDERLTHFILDTILEKKIRNLTKLNGLEQSAICEMGNIMCGSYIRALSQLLEIESEVSVPGVCIDMGGAILSAPLSKILHISEEILLIENMFSMSGESFVGRILFLPELKSLERLTRESGE